MNESKRRISIQIEINQNDGSYSNTTLHRETLAFPVPVDFEKVGRAITRRLTAALETIEDFHGATPVSSSGSVDVGVEL